MEDVWFFVVIVGDVDWGDVGFGGVGEDVWGGREMEFFCDECVVEFERRVCEFVKCIGDFLELWN